MALPSPASALRRWRPLALLLLAYLAIALHDLGAADIVGDDEAREVGIVQSILAGHWLLPMFNDELLPDKPILYHWLAALSAKSAGFSELTVRLPSALAGTATIAATVAAGSLMFDRRTALIGGALVATTPSFLTHARVARPDTLLVAILTCTFALAYRWWRERKRRDAVAIAILLGILVLTKGPVGPTLFVVGFGAFLFWEREPAQLLGLVTWPGAILFLVLAIGWYAVALGGWGERFVAEHLVGRYLRNFAGGLVTGHPYSPKPWAYHLLFYPRHLPAVLLPWTPVIAAAVWQGVRAGAFGQPTARFLLCWALAPVLTFTPAEWKLRYYLLPALPPCMLLAAPLVARLVRPGTAPAVPRARLAAVVVGLAVIACGVAAFMRPEQLSDSDRVLVEAMAGMLPEDPQGLALAAGVALGILVGALLRWSWAALLSGVAVAIIAWMGFGIPALEQATTAQASMKPLARAIVQRYPASVPIVFAGPTIRPLVVYAARTIPSHPVNTPFPPAQAVIAPIATYLGLLRNGRVGAPVVTGEGRATNLARTEVVVAEVLPR